MASHRPRDTGSVGAPRESEGQPAIHLGPVAFRPAMPANDNRLPLSQRLKRFVFLVTAAAALGWLYWVGAIR